MTGEPHLRGLIPLAYEELRQVARRRARQLGAGASLTPTDLVNEVLVRLLAGESGRRFNDANHLVSVAAMAMHNLLVDRARRRSAAKRGGHWSRVDLHDELPVAAPVDEMLAFHEACEQLRTMSARHFELVLLRVYGGLSTAEIAAQRKQSTRTVEREWRFAKAVLKAGLPPGVSTAKACAADRT